MYNEHFGLKLLPFENVPDPAFFFDSGEYHNVLRRLTDAVAAGRGLMVVAGPIGSGKTTLSQKLMADLPADIVHLWLPEPSATDREILLLLLKRFGYATAWESRVLALVALRDRLMEINGKGNRCLLVVDEAHKITDEGLETIRLLNNLEEGASKLIQILLLGQEELIDMLKRADREHFRQRIANFEVLGRMRGQQVRDYVHHRLRVAGGDSSIIPDVLIEAVAEAAGGIPRLTNSLCDRALLHAFENRRTSVDSQDLLRAAEDVGLYRGAFHFLLARGIVKTIHPIPALAAAYDSTGSAPPMPSQPDAPAPIAMLEPVAATTSPAPAVAPTPAPIAPVIPFSTLPARQIPNAKSGLEFPVEEAQPTEERSVETARKPLVGALMLLATSVAALGISLLYYCSQAFRLYGGECLSHLLEDMF